MNEHRHAGAPRLIEWTGERCVPWAPDPQVNYEHLHRYMWAVGLVSGRRVLDLASGEGFGAAILADRAAGVVGIELDGLTVDHSNLNYATPKLNFVQGDALDLSRFEAGSFGAVTAFEMIEHVEDHERLMAGIARVLAPDGLLIISTPERGAYTDATVHSNPFHVREMNTEEFTTVLRREFEHVAIWGQRPIAGSVLIEGSDPVAGLSDEQREPPRAAPTSPWFVERSGEDWREAKFLSPLYVVAVASNAPLPLAPAASVLADCGLELVRAAERYAAGAASNAGEARVEELTTLLNDTRASYASEVAAARANWEELQARIRYLEAKEVELGQALIDVHECELALQDSDLVLRERDAELGEARQEIAALGLELAAEHSALERLGGQLEEAWAARRLIESSMSWHAVQRLRGLAFSMSGGESTRRGRAIKRLARTAAAPLIRSGPR